METETETISNIVRYVCDGDGLIVERIQWETYLI